MSKSVKGLDWDVNLIIKRNRAAALDLNSLKSKTCFEDFATFPLVDYDYVTKHGKVGVNENLIRDLKGFLNQYREGGLSNVAKNLWKYFRFQNLNGLNVGSDDGIERYRQEVISSVTQGVISRGTAKERIGFIGSFLQYAGVISKPLTLSFSNINRNTGTSKSGLADPYTETELLEVVRVIYSAYEQCKAVLEEHMRQRESGVRGFALDLHVGAIFTYTTGHIDPQKNHTFEYPISSTLLLKQFFSAAAFIFAYHTWGNTTQVLDLKLSDMEVGDDRASSEYVYKGRGFKFVRLTIGNSEFISERAGFKWFSEYYEFRKRFGAFLSEYEKMDVVDSLFITRKGKSHTESLETRPLNTQDTAASINDGFVVQMLLDRFNFPNITIPRIRKTCEQFADFELQDPFTILEKAQHTWGTYQKSYSKGNPLSAKKNISAALNALKAASIDKQPFDQKQRQLDAIGIHLVDLTDRDVIPLANGFGCQATLPTTEIEKKFFQKQQKFGREPKACADFSSCVECEKCAVIEDSSSIYRMLSFKNSLEYSKVLYSGSDKAKERYMYVIGVINETLGLIDPKVVAIAEKRIKSEGYDPVWVH